MRLGLGMTITHPQTADGTPGAPPVAPVGTVQVNTDGSGNVTINTDGTGKVQTKTS